jgi:hypothetical protein
MTSIITSHQTHITLSLSAKMSFKPHGMILYNSWIIYCKSTHVLLKHNVMMWFKGLFKELYWVCVRMLFSGKIKRKEKMNGWDLIFNNIINCKRHLINVALHKIQLINSCIILHYNILDLPNSFCTFLPGQWLAKLHNSHFLMYHNP